VSKIPPIDVPVIHPRQKRGAARAENAQLREAITRVQELASITVERAADDLSAWSALGGIKYICAKALAGES
jgi:hypothetical protein